MPNKGFYFTLLKDIKIELDEEFDRNFERKAFFDQTWPGTNFPNHRGSMMARTNALRRSLNSEIQGEGIAYTSSLPYASIQNEGGQIKVTSSMKSFFWAMYYKASGAMSKTKGGKTAQTERNERLTKEAQAWKAMALKKVGSIIKIPPRRFIGNHPQVQKSIDRVMNDNLEELNNYMQKHWQKK